MEKALFESFSELFEERIRRYDYKTFGEDSIRYDFCFACLKIIGLSPTDLLLESEFSQDLYKPKEKKKKAKQGRHTFKPEIDLRIDSGPKVGNGIFAEFSYDRRNKGKKNNQDRTGNVFKIFNDLLRLRLLKLNNKDHDCLLVYVTDDEMLNYRPKKVRELSLLWEKLITNDLIVVEINELIGFLAAYRTSDNKTEDKFLSKAQELKVENIEVECIFRKSLDEIKGKIFIWKIKNLNNISS